MQGARDGGMRLLRHRRHALGSQVYDFNSGDDLGAPHWSLDESFGGWWVAPAEGAPDCPVVAADGSLFGGGHAEQPPKSPGSALPDSLPPSPGRAQNWDEEVGGPGRRLADGQF